MYVNFWGMLYNKQMFQEAGLPELTTESVITFDDWITYARARNKPADTLEEPGGREGGSTSASPASL